MSRRVDELRSALCDAAERAAEVLRHERRAVVLSRLVETAGRRSWIAAIGVALIVLGGGAGAWADAGGIALGLALVAAILVLVNEVSAARVVDERDALSRWDTELATHDRLLTAHEFLAAGQRNGFMQAAIDDARPALDRARGIELRRATSGASLWHAATSQSARNGLAAGLLLILCALLLRPYVSSERTSATPGAEIARVAGTRASPPTSVHSRDPRGTELETLAPPATTQPPGGREAAEEGESGEIPDSSRDTRGATGEGRSAEASSSHGAGQSKGVPSAQGQVSVPAESKKKPRKRKRPGAPDATPAENKKKGDEEKSGSTAGSGAASGSNRNPSTSEWSSKDQVSETDDDPVEDDSDVDDEDSESEARGGMQPNLRDRRPPVNRDLSVGFGNQSDEESNGRGGPGQTKKSRGTASLVLGVPIPDHIKGQPNPGRTKITQERVEPKNDDAAQVAASERGPRNGPTGHIARPHMTPWMRALVRAFFLSEDGGPSGASPRAEN